MNKAVEVRQHNAITNARYEYTEMQLDIFLYLLSKLRKDKTDGIYEVSVIEMGKLTGKKYNYQQLRLATEGMGSRMFEVSTPRSYIQLWMFQRIEYVHGTGVIEVEFANPIKPYLFDLKDNFTSFQLYSALRLGSKFAKRIYTICSQWRDKNQTQTFSLDEFKKMLSLLDDKGNEQFERLSDFKRYVLDASVKQINKYTDLEVGYKLEKKGRSFQDITFTVKAQPLAVVLPIEDLSVKVGTTPIGISDNQYQNVRLLLEQWNIKRADVVNQIMSSAELIQEVNKFAYELQTGKVKVEKNVAGYLLTRLGFKLPKGKEKDL
jgi:plasmid replication initiation protein